MERFDFKGDWEFDLTLNQLSDAFSFTWIGEPNKRRETIKVQIIDVKDENPNPAVAQINAINFIINHQDLILASLFESLKKTIIPTYQTAIGHDEDIFVQLDSLQDLNQFLGLNKICIFNKWKEDHAYALFYFNAFRCNLEHGLNMIFHKERFIGVHEDFKEAYEDLGLQYKEVLKEMSLEHQHKLENKSFKFYKSKSEHLPLKPWQQLENKFYLSRLLHTQQPDKLITFMEEHKGQLDYNWNTIHNLAKQYKFQEVINYLEKIK